MKYFFDTYALFEIINKNENYLRFSEEELVTSSLNLGELYYGFLKSGNKKTALRWFNQFRNHTIQVNEEIIRKAMDFKFENRKKNFSFIDCVGYMAAKEHNLLFLTGDKEFHSMANVEFVNAAAENKQEKTGK